MVSDSQLIKFYSKYLKEPKGLTQLIECLYQEWDGSIYWVFGLIYSSVIFLIIRIELGPNAPSFGTNHPKYWLFELIFIPSFFLITGVLLYNHFQGKSDMERTYPLFLRFVIFLEQVVLDSLMMVLALQSSVSYFFRLVTVIPLFVPLYSLSLARLGGGD